MNYQTPAPPGDPFERYAAGSSGRRFGDLLRHNGKTGGWWIGINSDPIEIGARFVVIFTEAYVGFVKWEDAEPDQVVVPLHSNPDVRALRESLGDLDPDLWPDRTAKVKPRDPWRPAVLLPFVKPETRDGFTFSTSSTGGEQAARRLIGDCALERRRFPEETNGRLPLVEFGETSYQHPDRRFGTLFNPTFEVVDWVLATTIAETLQRMGVEVPAIGHGANKPKLVQLGAVRGERETIHEAAEPETKTSPVEQKKPSKPAKRKLSSWKDLSDDDPDVTAVPFSDDED